MDPISLLVGWGVPAKLAKPLLIGLGVLLFVGAAVAMVKIHDHRVIADAQTKVEQRAASATDQAASERANDTIATSKSEQEAHNAVQAQPDQPISPTSHALACKRLHDAGRNPPACR